MPLSLVLSVDRSFPYPANVVRAQLSQFIQLWTERPHAIVPKSAPIYQNPSLLSPVVLFFYMLQTILTALVATLLWTQASSGHTIQLKAHSRECFHEQLHRDDRMTVTFQVGDREFGTSGNLDIDFFVRRSF